MPQPRPRDTSGSRDRRGTHPAPPPRAGHTDAGTRSIILYWKRIGLSSKRRLHERAGGAARAVGGGGSRGDLSSRTCSEVVVASAACRREREPRGTPPPAPSRLGSA